jgi:hypothetical protein
MTAASTWEQLNADYLRDGLAWLRGLLIGSDVAASDADPPPSALAAGQPVPDGIAEAVPAGQPWWSAPKYLDANPPPALEILSARFGLTRFETLLLLLCAAMELDPAAPAHCARANGDPATAAPTIALALSALPEPSWDAVSPGRGLRYWRLIEVVATDNRPLTLCPLRADERIVNYIKGLNDLDDRLAPWIRPVPNLFGTQLLPSHESAVQRMVQEWSVPGADPRLPVVEVVGPDARCRRYLAATAVSRFGFDLFELPAAQLPGSPTDLVELTRLLEREARLLPIAYFVDAAEIPPDAATTVQTLAADLDAMLLLGLHEPMTVTDRRCRIVDAARPTTAEQQDHWLARLGQGNAQLAIRLADHFDLDPATIDECAMHTTTGVAGSALDTPSATQLWRVCRDQARPRLSSLARRIDPQATWDDLVLAARELEALHRLADQVRGRPTVLRSWGLQDRRHRGAGIAALFAGQSGTGKTLAAEVLAHDLDLILYRIDLSGVVSKYIGETERNLRRVFDAAEQGGTLLFFDEADALFGKRSEVRDSHDRYANIEINYLLQRIEDFNGLAVLATNQRSALDTAFLRRLRTVITFEFPGVDERRKLWQIAFSPTAPTTSLDLDRLAELPATGGMIRNIALNAASCAAGRSAEIDMPVIMAMAEAEFRTRALPLPAAAFRVNGAGAR